MVLFRYIINQKLIFIIFLYKWSFLLSFHWIMSSSRKVIKLVRTPSLFTIDEACAVSSFSVVPISFSVDPSPEVMTVRLPISSAGTHIIPHAASSTLKVPHQDTPTSNSSRPPYHSSGETLGSSRMPRRSSNSLH